jgi:NADH:ubiquinone oxidoreductase subunit
LLDRRVKPARDAAQSLGLTPTCCMSLAIESTSSRKYFASSSELIGIDSLPTLSSRSCGHVDAASAMVACTRGISRLSWREPMKTFLLRFFTWWNGATFGTLLWTSLYGELVGEDEFGNRYYRTRGGKIDPTLGRERRWVIYNGLAEASTVPPSWHGWLHHTVDVPPTEDKVTPRPWWKPHRPNLTGTPGAHRPTGSTLAQGRRPKATGDYKAWTPGR